MLYYNTNSPDKSVAFIFEDSNLLDLTVWAENLLQRLLSGTLG